MSSLDPAIFNPFAKHGIDAKCVNMKNDALPPIFSPQPRLKRKVLPGGIKAQWGSEILGSRTLEESWQNLLPRPLLAETTCFLESKHPETLSSTFT